MIWNDFFLNNARRYELLCIFMHLCPSSSSFCSDLTLISQRPKKHKSFKVLINIKKIKLMKVINVTAWKVKFKATMCQYFKIYKRLFTNMRLNVHGYLEILAQNILFFMHNNYISEKNGGIIDNIFSSI